MSNLLNRKTAVVSLVAAAVFAGGAAFAYPSGFDLTVSATASSSGGVATVMNANPSCATKIEVDGVLVATIPAGSTTGSAPFSVAGLEPGRHSVRARTLDCLKGEKEHAKSKFVIIDAQVDGAPTAKVRVNYEVEVTGLEPGTPVSVTATFGGTGVAQLNDSDIADRRGEAKTKFKFKNAGTWSIVVTANGTVLQTYNVTVTP